LSFVPSVSGTPPGNVMSGHVLVVASGFGKRIIPHRTPFQFDLDPAGSLRVVVDGGPPIIVGTDHTPADAQSPEADVVAGPEWPAWWLQTTPYRIPLPAGWTAHASGGMDPSAFDLVGAHDSLMFLQTPRRVPRIEQMVGPGQRLVERGSLTHGEYVIVEYTHQDCCFLQRHVVVPVGNSSVVMTLQCLASVFASVEGTQHFLADNVLQGEE
jgi:hypothetical protein